jgi:hypothetical protein
LKEDIYIRKFIPIILEDSLSNKFNKLFNKNNFNIKETNFKYNIQILAESDFNQIFDYVENINKIVFYFSKIWVLKYQT